MVWYQMETFPTFIKLWGHITGELLANNSYNFIIENTYDVAAFEGKKYLYLSEVNSFGGTNTFMGIMLLSFAGVVFFIMFVFVVLYFFKIKGKDIYSTENMKW
mmetsp:Transcript_12838/g.9301  ORF Transcript_12838/g.9301 Transcript_12838/m.9301 type:complete len:103 (+) Transcript_12838:702-1010(+)